MQLFDGYALLIGAGKLPAQLSSLKAAIINAETLYQTLTILSGYRTANTTRLIGPAATRTQILNQVERGLPSTVKPSTLFLFYFSGYGCLEKATGRYFFLPADADPHNLGRTALAADVLADALANLPACRRLVILDCNPLQSDQLEQWGSAVGTSYALVPPPPEVLRRFCGPQEWAVLSSAEIQQISTIDRQSGGSLFTAEIVDVLAGEVAGIKPGLLQLDTLVEHLMNLVTHTAFHVYHCHQRPAALLTGHSFPVALIFGTAKGFEPEHEEWRRDAQHGQHAKPPVHSDQPSDSSALTEDGSSGEEPFSFGMGGEELAGPVMRGTPETTGADGPPAASPEINTGGGAAINGNVSTEGGDFAGRDMIKNNVSAKYVIYLNNNQGEKIGDNLALLKDPDQVIDHLSLRLVVAACRRVYLNEPFQIATAIRLPKSPALVVNGLPSVSVDEFIALQTQKEYIQLRLQVHESASYQVIGKSYYDIAYLPGTDSPLYYFELEAHQTGKIYIILEITQDLGSVGSTRIVTTAAARKKPAGRVVAEVESREPVKIEDVLAALNLLVAQVKGPTTRDQAAVAVRSLEAEARLGEQADAGRVQLWLGVLESCAPEIWKATLAAFRQPVIGAGSIIRKVAESETLQAGL